MAITRLLLQFVASVGIVAMFGLTGCAKEAKPVPTGDREVAEPNGRVPEPAKPAEPLKPRALRGPHGIEIAPIASEVLAVLDVQGIPYTGMTDEIVRARRLLDSQGIETDAWARSIYVDDPSLVDGADYRFRVAIPVARDAYPRPPLRRVVREPAVIARVVHRGDFDDSYQIRCYETVPSRDSEDGFRDHRSGRGSVPLLGVGCGPPPEWETEVRYPVARMPKAKAKPKPKAKNDEAEVLNRSRVRPVSGGERADTGSSERSRPSGPSSFRSGTTVRSPTCRARRFAACRWPGRYSRPAMKCSFATRNSIWYGRTARRISATHSAIAASCSSGTRISNPRSSCPDCCSGRRGSERGYPDLPIAVGGGYVAVLPREAMRFDGPVNYYVRGYGEDACPALADAIRGERGLDDVPALIFERDGVRENSAGRPRKPHPDNLVPYRLLDLSPYVQRGGIFGNSFATFILGTGQGCAKACDFCYWRNHAPSLLRAEAIVDLAAFLRENYGVRQFHFGELDFFASKARVLEIARLWRARIPDAVWFALASPVDAARLTDSEWDLLVRGGCRKIEFGTETGSSKTLRAIGKRHDPDTPLRLTRTLLARGIVPMHNFVFGFVGETASMRRRTPPTSSGGFGRWLRIVS